MDAVLRERVVHARLKKKKSDAWACVHWQVVHGTGSSHARASCSCTKSLKRFVSASCPLDADMNST